MTPDQHNKAVKEAYPLNSQLSINSRAHGPFPSMTQIMGYEYGPSGRILLRLKHLGPRHWNQPREFVFDPETASVAQEDIELVPLSEKEQHNMAVLRSFRVHDNISVRTQDDPNGVRFGHVTGFVYDDHGRIFIRVQFIDHFSKPAKQALINPNTYTTQVTKID